MFDLDLNNSQFRRVEKYATQVRRIYLTAISELVQLVSNTHINSSKPFTFSDYPALNKRAKEVFKWMSEEIEGTIVNGIEQEWDESNRVNDSRTERVFEFQKLAKIPIEYLLRNLQARDAFIARKSGKNGLSLSQRIWNYTGQFRQEIEMAFDIGITEGRSAARLSRDIRNYLDEPEKLFRRVRDSRGILQLSKNAKAYHPGQGIYRSSYKNAMRLTRTETNIAYRTADYTRWQQLPFIQGLEVRLSNNHTVVDICDTLKGKYSKEFKFIGWHPNCRCYAVAILPTDAEFDKMEKALLNGEQDLISSRRVIGVPDGFNNWVKEHKQQIKESKKRGTVPYFIKDNPRFVKV